MTIYDLKILSMRNPLGIDRQPYFSWKMKSETPDTMQSGYRIIVKEKDGDIVMDTGFIESQENTFIPYEGKRLKSSMTYEVTVEIKDDHGKTAQTDALFETALLQRSDWKAEWAISPLKTKRRKTGFGKQNPATLFRKGFELKGKPVKARVYATCHGSYELEVNGKRPDERYFAPEHTVYKKYLCYQTYDVTDLLNEGKNVLGMQVADGWYFCPLAKPDMVTDGRHAILFQLEATYDDGSKELIMSDTSVKASYGPVLSADLYAGEYYDANQEIEGWSEASYDDGSWKFCRKKDYGKDNLVAQLGEPVEAMKILKAVNITKSPKGETIIDFGQNMAGVVRVKVDLPAGKSVSLEHCEVLDRQGNYFNNIMAAGGVGKGVDQKDVYISNGRSAVFEPHFTYHGFRYVKVEGVDDVKAEDFEAIVLSTRKEDNGTFETSDPDIDRLYQNIRWSQTSNMLSIPTDCPQREKAGWTGDMQVYSGTAMLNEDCTAFFTRWLENMTCDQGDDGVIPMVVPCNGNYPMMARFINLSVGEKGKATSSGWGDAAVTVPWSMYEVTGNIRILEQQYETMKKWCEFIIRTAALKKPKKSTLPADIENYLWDTGYHYGEWLIPSQNRNGIDMKNLKNIMAESSCYTAPIFGYYSISTMAMIAKILNRKEDEDRYEEIASKMKDAIQKGVIRTDGTMPSQLMGAYVMPISFDLVPDGFKDTFAKKLMEIIDANGGVMDTGFLGTPYLLDALVKIGRADIAEKMLWQKKAPSWLSEVEAGATTIWENCFGYDEQGNPNSLSFNHYAFGCVAEWIFANLAGIKPLEAGYRTFEVSPLPAEKLDYCHRRFRSMQGDIEVDWKKKDGIFYLDVTVPCNSKAHIVLPDGKAYDVGSGRYSYSCSL